MDDSRQAGQEIEIMKAGRAAFYSVLDMPPFSSATVDDLVSAIACAVLAVSRNAKPRREVRT
jgi:hypothetical protein